MTNTLTKAAALRIAAQTNKLLAEHSRTSERQNCANCGNIPHGYAYGNAWCEDCLHMQGYLPDSWNTEETWASFKPLFQFMTARGLWVQLQALAKRWDADAEALVAGLTIDQLISGVFPRQVGCRTCAAVLPAKGAVNGCCSRKCYGIWYREAKAAELEEARINRDEERKRKAAALK